MARGVPITAEMAREWMALSAQGHSHLQISEKYDVTHECVCRVLRKVQSKAWEKLIEDVSYIRMSHYMKLDHLCMVAMSGYLKTQTASLLETYRQSLEDIRTLFGISPKLQIQAVAGEPIAGSDEVTQALERLSAIARGESPAALGHDNTDDDYDNTDDDYDEDDPWSQPRRVIPTTATVEQPSADSQQLTFGWDEPTNGDVLPPMSSELSQ